jgi:hypothetical protein
MIMAAIIIVGVVGIGACWLSPRQMINRLRLEKNAICSYG